jgi:hypothetical protein
MKPTNNFKQLMIAKAISTSALSPAVATPSNVADGEVVITDLAGRILDATLAAAATVDQIVFVQGQGAANPLRTSAPITKTQLRTAKYKNYAAATQQVDYIGYNPVAAAGSIDTTVTGNAIIVRNMFKTNFYQFSDKLMESIVGYKVLSTDTQASVATNLVKAINLDVLKYVNKPYIAEAVCNDAGVANAIPGGADYTHFKFTNGSTRVVGTDSNGVEMNGSDETNANIVAGVYVRVGTATTSPVYKVLTATAGTGATPAGTPFYFDLATPYVGTTSIIAVASTEYITAALAGAADFGVRITGLPQRLFSESKPFRYETSKWDLSVQNAGATTITSKYVLGTEGTGTYEQIAEAEWFFNFSEGFADQQSIQVPPVTFIKNVETTGTYKIVSLEYGKQAGTFDILSNPVASLQLDIAVNVLGGTPTQYSDATDGIAAVFNAWAGATYLA